MTIAASGEMCRLVVCGPDRHVDVAVPAHVLIADLLPVLLHNLGDNLADAGLLHGGWVLQRLGAPPYEEEATIASLGLRDGDVVHLRPRAEQIPPVDFDDLIDGVATGLQDRPGRWRPALTRWTALTSVVLLLAVGLALLAMPGEPVLRTAVAAVLAVGCLAAAYACTHAVGDRAGGLIFGAGATGFAGLAGVLAASDIATTSDHPALALLAGPEVFAGVVAVLATAIIGVVLVGWVRPLLPAVTIIGLSAVGGVALVTYMPLTVARAAAVVVVVSTLAGSAVPVLAFRIAGLHLAPLPTAPEHLQEDLDPVPSEQLLTRAATADRAMTSLYIGLAVPVAVGLVILGGEPGWAPTTLVVLVCLVRALAARPMTSGWHRLAMLAPIGCGAVAAGLDAAAEAPGLRLLLPLTVVPLGAAVLVALARYLPGRRLMPYWGRIGDLVQTAAAVAMLPVLLAVLDVYGYARALGG